MNYHQRTSQVAVAQKLSPGPNTVPASLANLIDQRLRRANSFIHIHSYNKNEVMQEYYSEHE